MGIKLNKTILQIQKWVSLVRRDSLNKTPFQTFKLQNNADQNKLSGIQRYFNRQIIKMFDRYLHNNKLNTTNIKCHFYFLPQRIVGLYGPW